MPIRIPIIADVVDAIRGAKRLEESFDDVADALADVDHKSAGAGDGVDDVGDHATSTKRDAAEMEASFRDAFETVRKESKSAGDGVSTAMRHGTDDATEGVQEFGRESESTAKETAASFDGSAQSITGAFQEVAANAFSGFGPAGAVAGLAAAAGIGIVTARMEQAKEKAAEAAQEIADITGQLIELGKRDLDVQSVSDAIEQAASTSEDGKVALQEWAKQATEAGIDFTDYAQGLAGDSDAIERSYSEITKALAAQSGVHDELVRKYGLGSRQLQEFNESAYAEADALTVAKKALEEKDGTLNKSAQTYDLVKKAQEGLVAQSEQEAAAAERSTEAHESYQDALADSGDAVSVFEDLLSTKTDAMKTAAQAHADDTVEATGQAADSWEDYATDVTVSTDELIAEWNRQADEAAAFETNLATIAANGGQALADELRAKGPEVAGAVAAVVATADPATQQAAIDAHARATGTAMGGAMAAGITSQQGAVQGAVDGVAAGITTPWFPVKVTVDDSAVTSWIANIQNTEHRLNMTALVTGTRMV